MKTIAVVTATRAEYGILHPVISALRSMENEEFRVELIVTGTHLSYDYGYTIDEIKNDGVRVDEEIITSVKANEPCDTAVNQADYLVKFAELFVRKHYDGMVILGDRYEILAVAIAAANVNIPIFHMSGGDTTEGAIDEWIRHSLTKMSYMHFPGCETSRKRIIQLGENPARVFNYGETGVDNILNVELFSIEEVFAKLKLDTGRFALCTYHPVTMENENVEDKINELLGAVKYFSDIEFVFTKANADCGGAIINELLDKAAEKIDNMHVYPSLGVKLYLSVMKKALFVLGNSSSGIIEAPVFHIPTVNIGDRQRGRLQCNSIINCKEDTESIIAAIRIAMSDDFHVICQNVVSPYGDGHAGSKIAKEIYDAVISGKIDLKKKFFDIDMDAVAKI